MKTARRLLVVADDYGMGPATSEGILELARAGHLSATVLLVNTPYAASSVEAWFRAGRPLALGWHPNLTLDSPLLPAEQVPSLVNQEGRFWSLGQFMIRLMAGQIQASEIHAELSAQYRTFCELVGHPPALVNSHQHVQIFPPVGTILQTILAEGQSWHPYVRRVGEPLATVTKIAGGRLKRAFLTLRGRANARQLASAGFPGNDALAGVTDPAFVADPHFFTRWLETVPGQTVELACHPGRHDPTLIGRDCRREGIDLWRRMHELVLVRHPSFNEACRRAGFVRVPADDDLLSVPRRFRHAG